jgi:hypothetical protein
MNDEKPMTKYFGDMNCWEVFLFIFVVYCLIFLYDFIKGLA